MHCFKKVTKHFMSQDNSGTAWR